MPDSNKSVLQFLQDLRKERDELNNLIQATEKRLGISSSSQGSVPADDQQEVELTPSVTSLPIGFFHNLSQAAAAEKLLKLNRGKPLTTAEILEIFRNSGMSVNPKNALTILYTALKRSQKFERVGSKAWGLKEWYPERKKRISKEEEEPSDEAGA
jgi:hypothetical protein